MTLRSAAESAHLLCCSEDRQVAALGLSLLTELANQDCYCAILSLVYFYDRGGVVNPDRAVAKRWAARARAMHDQLADPEDLYDAGMRCMWDELFESTPEDALRLWERAARLGSGEALYAICDSTRSSPQRSLDWANMLESAARLGCTQAMVEFSEQAHVRGTPIEHVWLRAALALGSLRAKEILGADEREAPADSNKFH